MKAVVLEQFGGPEVLGEPREVAEPAPGLGDVLVEVRACGVCYLDTIVRRGIRPGVELPLVLGHEISGVIAELGAGVKGFSAGQRVASTFRAVCGYCWYCRDERSVYCTNVQAVGVDRDGGYAELVVLPASSLAPVPDGVSDVLAAFTGCVLGAVYRGVREKARVRPGDNVLVTGAGGGAGIHAVQLASLAGGRVLAASTSPQKHAEIRRQGAAEVLGGEQDEVVAQVYELTGGRGADVVLDCVGKATSSISLRSLARGGRLVFIGELGVEPVRVSVPRMLYREAEIYGVASPAAGEQATLLELVANGQVTPVVSDVLPLERAAEAHQQLEDRTNIGKVVLTINGE